MAPLKKNETVTADITGWSSDGDGVARVGGQVMFVRGAIEGETCRVRVLKAGKNAAWGRAEEIIVPSPHRITPACPSFGKCGGCGLLHMDYGEELRFKRQKVDDALARIGGLDLRTESITGADEPEGYRNKAIYSVGGVTGAAVMGFYRRRSHDVVGAEGCLIETGYSRRAAEAVRRWMNEYGIPPYDPGTGEGVRRVFCRYGQGTGQGQTVVVTGTAVLPGKDELVAAVTAACPETVSIMQNVNGAPGDTVLSPEYIPVWGADAIRDTLCGFGFELAPGAFYQVNRAQAQRLYEKAVEFAAPDGCRVLDLYCGAGTITLCLAGKAAEAVGAEIVPAAVENARKNAADNGVRNVRFICADAAEAARTLLDEGFRPDVITVDPPRKGLLPGTAEVIASMGPERVVYVSCDPATLARDLKIFAGLGYKAVRAAAFDLFPRTNHVECVTLITHK